MAKTTAARHMLAAAALLSFCAASQAGELRAYAGKSISLKNVNGTIYYAPKGDAFEVTATLDSEGHPFRVVTALKDGQSATLSAPGALGEDAATVEIKREGDHLFVTDRTRQHRAELASPSAE